MITTEDYRAAVGVAEKTADLDEHDEAVVKFLNKLARAQNNRLEELMLVQMRFWEGEEGEYAEGRAAGHREAARMVADQMPM